MDYDLEYHREMERKMNMLYENISTTTEATQKNKDSIIKLHYKLDFITILLIITLSFNLPQALPYLSEIMKFLLQII